MLLAHPALTTSPQSGLGENPLDEALPADRGAK